MGKDAENVFVSNKKSDALWQRVKFLIKILLTLKLLDLLLQVLYFSYQLLN
jgi:hypothetical protein